MNRIRFTDALIADGHQQESATRQKKGKSPETQIPSDAKFSTCWFLCDQMFLIFVFFEHREAIQPRSRVCLGGHGRAFKRS